GTVSICIYLYTLFLYKKAAHICQQNPRSIFPLQFGHSSAAPLPINTLLLSLLSAFHLSVCLSLFFSSFFWDFFVVLLKSVKKMSGDQHMEEMHYMNMGFPYNVPESFPGFLDGVSQAPIIQYHNNPVQIQENAYWSMNMSYYKYEHSNLESTSYHSYENGNNHVSRPDFAERPWEYAVPMNVHEGVSTDVIYEENTVPVEDPGTEECVLSNQDDSNHQDILEDEIDPDNMTYEELLDLGETVGTESRGLPEELINLLPTTKYKSNGIFSRKKSEERCVICQMRYKRGDRQINFPCKHIYHTECGSKWLSINKTCPICNTEVLLDE
ncbi:hypothetical protein AABB24_021927, partial [Solanum stoloniferum]